ncbi:MAG: hypothetical protein AAF802_06730 [Planctomycetota bacterium]
MKPIRFAFTVAVLVAAITFVISHRFRTPIRLARPSSETVSSQQVRLDEEVSRRFERARFFDTQIVPVIEETQCQNIVAAERCVMRIHELLRRYRDGINPFVGEITSIKTRFGILKRMPTDWWNKDKRIEQYVEAKFAKHLFTEEELTSDLTAVLVDLHHEIQANQNRMLARVQVAMTTADLPDVTLEAPAEFFAPISDELASYSTGQGVASVENMLGAFVLGEAGAFAARSIVAGLLARFAPSAALSVAAGTSATVGASATGAGGGSLGGPIGTVVGFGAGLVIGLVIDWWMTEQFESKLKQKLNVYLDDLQSALLYGAPSDRVGPSHVNGQGDLHPSAGGLVKALPIVCQELQHAYRNRFFEQVVEDPR